MSDKKGSKRDRSSSSNETPARKKPPPQQKPPTQASTLGDLYGGEPSRDSGRSRGPPGDSRGGRPLSHSRGAAPPQPQSTLGDLYGAEPSRDAARRGPPQARGGYQQQSGLGDLYGEEPTRDATRRGPPQARGGYQQQSGLGDLYGEEPTRDAARRGPPQARGGYQQQSGLGDLYGEEPTRDATRRGPPQARGGYQQQSGLGDLYGPEPSRGPAQRGSRGGYQPQAGPRGGYGGSYAGSSRDVSRGGPEGTQMCKANYFALGCLPSWSLRSYTPTFSPQIESLPLRKGLLKSHKELFGIFMFDGNTLYTRNELESPLELVCLRNEDQSEVKLTLTLSNVIEEGDPFFIQLWSIVFRKCLAELQFLKMDRNFFDLKSKKSMPNLNIEIWPGFRTGIHLREKLMLLQIDVCHKVLRKETAYDLYQECRRGNDPDWKKVFASAIVGSVVITPYNNRSYKIHEVEFDKSPESTFPTKNGEKKFTDYYRERYGIVIHDPSQPTLITRPTLKEIRAGKKDEPVTLIPELCCLTGLSDRMRADFRVMREIADTTRSTPRDRIIKLESDLMGKMLCNEEIQSELRNWHIGISPKLIDVPCTIFPPEKIVLKQNATFVADKQTADFGRSFRNQHLFMGMTISIWVVLFPGRLSRSIDQFVGLLTKTSKDMGVFMHPPTLVPLRDDSAQTYLYEIENIVSKRPVQLAMFVLPNEQTTRYDAIKRKCYIERTIPSQVVLAKKLDGKGVGSIATKIAIQINCKVGGSPWTSIIPFKHTVMVMGYTVCTDSRNKSCCYSCLTASLNGNFTRYYSDVAKNGTIGNMSDTIGLQVSKAISAFSQTNGGPPKKIIIYRDAISQGMHSAVREHEVDKIKEQLTNFYPGSTPDSVEFAVIVVNPKTNTRIFFENSNPYPGTVVDSTITSPFEQDFYLVSQSVRQGTVSPTHYSMLHNNVNLAPDVIQKLTYKLTHLYFNWSGTIKVPAPVQYARKLGVMVSQHIHNIPTAALQETLFYL